MRPAHLDLHEPAVRRRGERVLGTAAAVAFAATLVLGLWIAPPDAVQGQSQRLMYLHVPAAWTGFLAVGVVALASLVVLLGGGRFWTSLARGAGELALAMLALAYAEGMTWGHAAWGVWWTWDPRLVTTGVLLLTCVGYVAMSALARDDRGGDSRAGARRTALVGLLAAVEVPVVHLSVLWWRSIHQPPTLLRPSLSAPIDSTMLVALLVAVVAFTLGGAWYVARRLDQQLPAASPEAAGPEAVQPEPAASDAAVPAAEPVLGARR